MKIGEPDWYKKIWSLDIKGQSWTEDTENQTAFLIKTLELTGGERILDLACGYGRHALSFARKGFPVVGVDITQAYVEDARQTAKAEGLPADFIHGDIRELTFADAFDVVLNLADGAIGYLESDEENLKIFDVIARALKPGGKHFMDVVNAEHAEAFFPKRHWEAGEKALALAEFDWDRESRRMLYGGWDIPYGQPAQKPSVAVECPTRLYSLSELQTILERRDMRVMGAFSDYRGRPATYKELQLMVYSTKKVVS